MTTLPLTEAIILIVYVLYAGCLCYAWRGLRLQPEKNDTYAELPSVSVIVVAKDEAENLPVTLASLKQLNYPENKLEIILVNDRSADKTGELMRSYHKAKYIEISTLSSQYTGKANGLIQGIRQSSGEILFFTDADCLVPPSWIYDNLPWFQQGYNCVGGALILDHSQWQHSGFAKIQTLDWLYFTLLGAALNCRNFPVSLWGNNFAIRKTTYTKSGGFEKAGRHILEDFALLKQVTRIKEKTAITIEAPTAVRTKPVNDLKAFYHQRKRWAIGARSHHWMVHALAGLTALFYSIILVSLVLKSMFLFLAGVCIFIISDLKFLHYGCNRLHKMNLLKYYPLYKVFSLFYILVFIPIFLFGQSAQWKDNTYQAEN